MQMVDDHFALFDRVEMRLKAKEQSKKNEALREEQRRLKAEKIVLEERGVQQMEEIMDLRRQIEVKSQLIAEQQKKTKLFN